MKGTGPISYHLGMDFFRDEYGTLCYGPRKYIQKMMDGYFQMFGEQPKTVYHSPLEPNDHPEVDESEFCDPDDIQKYQSMIGSSQWAITIGRIDITTPIMTLSGFRQSPKIGHLDRAKRVYGYLKKMKDAAIRIRIEEPDYSELVEPDYNWDFSVYGEGSELLPHDLPIPL